MSKFDEFDGVSIKRDKRDSKKLRKMRSPEVKGSKPNRQKDLHKKYSFE